MALRFYSDRNLKFLLHEVFDAASLCGLAHYRMHSRKVFEMVLDEAARMAKDLLLPVFQEMDRHPPELIDGQVRVHPTVAKTMAAFGEGGWIATTVPLDLGGEQLPHLIADACHYVFCCANYSASAYVGLSDGAARLIETFGSRALYDTYVPHMRAGRWQGTMALTEPEAGSSLADIATTARPTDKGYYLIKGQKIFISAGDHDAVDNVVHLMLAKIEGAPAGVRGISLFVVPKKRPDPEGRPVANDVAASGVYHKLGYRGCPIVQLSIGDHDDCRGWLVGQPHQGLAYMFQMMNEARIGVGLGATAMATAAYHAALDYARKRRQGRLLGQKDPAMPPVPIIAHADVRRMLLFQRAVVEGSLALLLQCSWWVDMQKGDDPEQARRCALLLDLLTPVAKTYPSEMGIAAISNGLQCFGGSGYCDDYPLEQYYRDARIHPIHEGTTGIHGLDLLGRKVVMQNGAALALFNEQVSTAIQEAAQIDELAAYAGQLETALARLNEVTAHLVRRLRDRGPAYGLADATLYLELFGIVTIAWQWLVQGVAACRGLAKASSQADKDFYTGKLHVLAYFFGYELPKTLGLGQVLTAGLPITVDMDSRHFTD